jgi:hypothetical protein
LVVSISLLSRSLAVRVEKSQVSPTISLASTIKRAREQAPRKPAIADADAFGPNRTKLSGAVCLQSTSLVA